MKFSSLLAGAAFVLSLFSATTPNVLAAETAPTTLRIGYQKTGDLLILKNQGEFAKRLAKQRTSVQWVQFPSGPPLLEALNAGSIDLGYTGDTPPIFAQAAGADLVYVGYVPAPGRYMAILVHSASNIHTLSDLRGKRVAFTKGSSAHNFVVQALAKANLQYTDIQPIYLQPADAAAAFANGAVDAWAIWDPLYAVTEHEPGVRVLTDAQNVAPSNSFYLARTAFATQYPTTIALVIQEVDRTSRWAAKHPEELAAVYAAETGVDLASEKIATARATYGVHYLTPEVIRQQQAIADTFVKLGLIPQKIDIASIVWNRAPRAALGPASSRARGD